MTATPDHGRHKPQTQVLEKGYNPQLSEGAAIPPVFRTSTFVFRDASQGKRAFELAYHLRTPEPGESPALIYTRVNNPNCEMVEDRVVAWDGAEAAALFSSGMGAIPAVCLTFLKPGDTLLFSDPVYGGTEFFFRQVLPGFGIRTIPFPAGSTRAEMAGLVGSDPSVRVVWVESPANPTIVLTDLADARAAADAVPGRKPALLIVDNTFMGPIFTQPLRFGADLVLCSATKFIGGHSDLVAGLALGSCDLISQVKVMRTVLGSNSDPDTAWLILRSLGTLQLHMEKQQENARKVVDFPRGHAKVARVAYPGGPDLGDAQLDVFRRQCTGSGSLLSFTIRGGEVEAFTVLDRVRVCRLAVSLGGIETLIEHPATMTHADMSDAEKALVGIGPDLIRIAVGLEYHDDLIENVRQALDPLSENARWRWTRQGEIDRTPHNDYRQVMRIVTTRARRTENPPDQAYVAVLRAANALQAGASDLLRAHGLTHNQYNVLRILRGAGPEGATCGQIAERMINRDPDITRLLDRLEKAGLAVRHRSARDRRTVVNCVTQSGLRLLGELDEPVAALHREQFATLDRAEVDHVIAWLTAVAGE